MPAARACRTLAPPATVAALMTALFVVCVIDILGFGILIPLVPYMADRFGVTPALITPILGIYSLCQLHRGAVMGAVERPLRPPADSDLEPLRRVCFLSAARICAQRRGSGGGAGSCGFMAGNIAAAFAYASDISAPAERAKSMGMVGAAIGIGFMLGPAIGGLLAGDDIQKRQFPAARHLVAAALSLVAIALV